MGPAGHERGALDVAERLRRDAPWLERETDPPPRPLRLAVVGGGIGGLALAHRTIGHADVTVFEAASRAGGHAFTVREDGFLVEAGPSTFVDRPCGVRSLARELGLSEDLIGIDPAARGRFVLRGRRLHRLPESPGSLLATGAVSPLGKLRLLLDLCLPARRGHREESVHEFARRRIGDEAADILVDSTVAGDIASADSRILSLPAAYPGLSNVEHERGALLRMLAGRPGPGRAAPVRRTFRGGMSQLVDALSGALGPRLRTDARVVRVEPAPQPAPFPWRVVLDGGAFHDADRVVLALPAHAAATVIEALDPDLSRRLADWRFSSVAVVSLAYRASDLTRTLEGEGYVVARSERLATLAVMHESNRFAGRAPQGFVLLRVLLGGTRHPDVARASDSTRIALAHAELGRVLGIRAGPFRAWTFAWRDAVPQYGRGHRERVAAARMAAAWHPGLALAGTCYDGISLGAAVESGRAHAEAILGGDA